MGDTNLLVDPSIGEVILSFGHGSYYDTDALIFVEALNVFSNVKDWCFPREGDLAAVWWEVLSNRVLDDTEKLLGGCRGADRELVEKLNHKTGETLERTWNTDGRIDFDKYTLGGLDVDLELSGFVEWRIQQC